MSNFNFNFSGTPTPSNVTYLKPYGIYDNVEIDKIEEKTGNKQDGGTWRCLNITFKNENGIYIERLFIPDPNNEKDVERREGESNGNKWMFCSNCEVFMARIASIASAYNPEGYKKMQEASSKFKSFDDVVKYFKAVISKAPGAKTSIKLVGTKKDSGIYAALPNALGTKLLDDGTWDVYPIRAFGDNLAFTNYEKKKKEEYENAKPSSAPSKKNENPDTLGVDSAEEDIDYDSLL